MKLSLISFGMIAALAAPLCAHADPESSRSGAEITHKKAPAHRQSSAKLTPSRSVFYVTNKSVTGSHLPLVVGRYRGHYASMSPIAVYGQPDLDRTGQLNVAGELIQRDPALSSVGAGVHR